jgi:hypothetical protein
VTLRARWVTLRARWVTLRARWVTLRARGVTFQVLLTEVGSKFMPNPEERLLAVVHALLHRFYKYPTATSGPVPPPLQRELAGA